MSDCIFCKIIEKQLPSKIEYEDEKCIAFHSIEPVAPVHLLIVPKKHIDSITTFEDKDQELIGHLFSVARDIAKSKEIPGYKLLFNVGKEGGQVIFHLHLHLLAGKKMSDSEINNT